MSEWTKEQLEEMFGDDVVEQLAFIAGCTKHSYSDPKNAELNGFIISHDSLYKFAELIISEASNYLIYAMEVHSQSEQDLMELAAKQLRERFGVKK